MKLRKGMMLLCGLVVLTFLVVACSSGPPSPDSPASDLNLSEAARITPENTQTIILMDLKKIREDEDLEDFYDRFTEDLSVFEDSFGVTFDDVSFMLTTVADQNSDSVILFHGDIVKLDIIDELENLEFEEDVYREVELWEETNSFGEPFLVGFPNTNRVVLGSDRNSIRAVIRASAGEETSLRENEDMKSVMDRLPSGLIYALTNACEEDDPDAFAGIRGCVAQGASAVKIDSSTMESVLVTKFDSESRAERELDDLEIAFLDEQEDIVFNVTSERSGVFVIFKGQTDIQDFIEDFLE